MSALRRGLLACVVVLAALPARAETLADTMVAAYRHSALLDQNRALLRAADEDVAVSMAALRPIVEWAASHEFQRTDGTETVQTTARLVAQMTLFDWGRNQLAIDIAKENVLATRESLIAVEQDVLLTAIQAYLDVRSAEQQVALQENSVNLLGEERQAAQDRFDVGEITSTDVALAEAQLAATRAGLASAQGGLEIARENFRTVVGRAPRDLAAPPPLPARPASVEAAQAAARQTHPVVRQAQRSAAAAELQVAAAAAERSPTVTGSAGLSATRQPQTARNAFGLPAGTEANNSGTLSASIQMQQTLYSGGRLPAVHRRAMANRDAARATLLNSARQVSQSGQWVEAPVAAATVQKLEDVILTRARDLRRTAVGG